jgi:hypothetical protein
VGAVETEEAKEAMGELMRDRLKGWEVEAKGWFEGATRCAPSGQESDLQPSPPSARHTGLACVMFWAPEVKQKQVQREEGEIPP